MGKNIQTKKERKKTAQMQFSLQLINEAQDDTSFICITL